MANKQTVFENNNATKPADDVWLNMVNSEYKNLCTGTGQTPDADNSQIVKGAIILASQASLFCVDSGTTNNYVLNPVSPLQAPPSLRNGLSIKFTTTNANSGSTNINAYGFGNILAKNQDGANLVAGDIPANTMVQFYYNGTNWILDKGAIKATTTTQGITYLNNPITIANNALDLNNDIDFSAGNAPLDDGSGQVLLSSTLVKRLDASWSAGTGNGGLFSSTKANSTRYYLFAITNGTINDAGFDSSPNGANIPAGYKGSYRGMVLTDSSGNIRRFIKSGQHFFYLPEITDHTPTPTSDVFDTYKLSCPEKSGILAIVTVQMRYTGTGTVTQAVNSRQTGTSFVNNFGGWAVQGWSDITFTQTLPLNSSAQIDIAFYFAAPSDLWAIRTKGYIDTNIK